VTTNEIPREPKSVKNTILNLNSFMFDVFAYSGDELIENVPYMYHSLGLLEEFNIDTRNIVNFLKRLQTYYHTNPYHNFMHAMDVTQFVYSCLCIDKIAGMFTPLEKLCLIFAAPCHDVDHPGLNNNYQINAKTPLALIYNDISVLENHHCCIAFRILREKDCNIVENLDPEDYKEFRKTAITTILATDMAQHFEILTKFQTRIQTGPLSKESKDDKQQLMNIILKCADVSNAVRPFSVAKRWAHMLIDEFLCQGDKEKELGLTVSPLMDRETMDKAQMQVNFIDYIAGPLYKTFLQFVPSLSNLSNSIQTNRMYWSTLLEKQKEEADDKESALEQTSTSNRENSPVAEEIIPILSVDEQDLDPIAKIKGFNILVIESNPADQAVVNLLKKNGYETVSSSSVSEALQLLKSEEAPKFDVAILDFATKGMNPIEFATEVRQFEANTKHYTAILGLLHSSSADGLQEVENIDVVLTKPTTAQKLLRSSEKCIVTSLNYAESVDIKLAVEQIGGDPDFLDELIVELVKDSKEKVGEMRGYIDNNDWPNLNLQSHSVKGASAQLACKPLCFSAFIVERSAKTHLEKKYGEEFENLNDSLELLEKRVAELDAFVSLMMASKQQQQ
jgi:CheY-like chemotaxis protein/HPt (histidine-containing phosphotransfer) domain-containing protein